jgi:hypothetical protein
MGQMSRTGIADALVAELRKLAPGQGGDRGALRAAIGCGAAELRCAIERLRFQGKLLWDRLELSPSQRAAPAAENEDAATDRPGLKPPDDRQTPARARATAHAPGGEEAQPGQPDRTQEPTGTSGAKRALPPQPSGAELKAEVLAYCQRTGTPRTRLSMAAVGHVSLLGALDATARPKDKTLEAVRRTMALWPEGVPPDAPGVRRARAPAKAPDTEAPHPAASQMSLSRDGRREEEAPAPVPAPFLGSGLREEVKADAIEEMRRRRTAGIAGGGSGTPLSPVMRRAVEAIQSEAVATAEDFVRAINRKHPQLMRRAVQLSRARGTTPAAALYAALEAGLSHVEQETSQ